MKILSPLAALLVPASLAAAQPRTPVSGTAWDPATASAHELHAPLEEWAFRFHGRAALYRADEGGLRGDEQWGSTNWFMGAAERRLGGGILRLRAMVSLEPFTVGGCGMPNLLQTGEVCDGEAIVDAQHPHELFSEIAVAYGRRLGGLVADVYLAPVGEPALGPVPFPHRASGRSIPVSPITHHWIDASHVSFGVATVGVEGRSWRVEASVFNGREPDDDRYDFDFAPLHAVSARLQLAPSERLAVQVSRGRLRNAHRHLVLLPPELDCPPVLALADGGCHIVDQGDPLLDVTRTTASVSYHHPAQAGRAWSVTAAWGRNDEEAHLDTDAAFVEGLVEAFGGGLFGRAEWVEKTDHDLAIRPTLAQFLSGEQRSFDLAKVVLGYGRAVLVTEGVRASVGAAVSWSRVPGALESSYGGRAPRSLTAFAAVEPAAMSR